MRRARRNGHNQGRRHKSASANCRPGWCRNGRKPAGKPESSQGNQRKRGKTVENKKRNAFNNQLGKDRDGGSGHQADSNPGVPGRERKDKSIETGDHARGGAGDTGNPASI